MVIDFYIYSINIVTCNVLNVKNHGKWPTAVAEAAASAPWKVTNIPWVRIFAPRSGKACLPSTLRQKLLFNCMTCIITLDDSKKGPVGNPVIIPVM